MRRMRTLSGIAAESRTPARRRSYTVTPQGSVSQPDHVERRKDEDGKGVADDRGRREGASRFESLATTDFRHITDPADMARAHALAERLARVMRARLVRREQIRQRGRRLDLRRTIHRNVSHGGTPVDLAWRRRKIKPLRLVVLLDPSGSMNLIPRSSSASCMAWWTLSAKRKHSFSTPGLRTCRHRCAIATSRVRWTSFR